MKFALLFVLGLFAISAHASSFETYQKEAQLLAVFKPVYAPMPRDGVIESVKEYIEGAIAAIKERVEAVIAKAKEIASSVKDKVGDVIKTGTEKAIQFVSEVDEKVRDLKAKGETYKACAEQYEGQVGDLFTKAKDDVKKCTADALEYAEKIHGNAVDQLLIVTEQIKNLRDAVKMCYQPTSPLAAMTCAVAKAKDVKNAVADIISNASGALTAGSSVATSSYACIKDSLIENKAQGDALVAEIKACAAKKSF